MKKNLLIKDAVNYQLTSQDLENPKTFKSFLNKLTDIPISEPENNISINSTGIHNQQVVIYIADFRDKKRFIPVPCDVSISVDLQKYRGIHMSRCIEAISDLATKRFSNLDDFSSELASIVRKKQESDSGIAEIVGTYIYKRKTKVTNKESLDKLYLLSNARVTQKTIQIKTGMKVYNFTACPCTKVYTKYSIVPDLHEMGLSLDQINKILQKTISGTHTQRGITTLMLDKETSQIGHKDLYTVLEKSVHLVYDLLKRPDEHELVIRALAQPQFVEDAVREVAFNAWQQFRHILPLNAEIDITTTLNDSIHIHDVHASIKKRLEEIGKEIERSK